VEKVLVDICVNSGRRLIKVERFLDALRFVDSSLRRCNGGENRRNIEDGARFFECQRELRGGSLSERIVPTMYQER